MCASPSPPKPIPPPPQPKTAQYGTSAAYRQTRAMQGMQGRTSTILTDSSGFFDTESKKKNNLLLGEG